MPPNSEHLRVASDRRESQRPSVAVNAILLNRADEVLLTRRRDVPVWCLPGGHLEVGETILRAVEREVDEEIGVRVTIERCTGIYSEPNLNVIPPATVPLIVLAFSCSIAAGTPGTSDEVSAVEYFPLNKLPALISTHEQRIRDALKRQPAPVIT
jgi:8-oxo-dGTP pyrophosphatase MutT (NUDIX family)